MLLTRSLLGLLSVMASLMAACGADRASDPVEVRRGARFDPDVPRRVIPDRLGCADCTVALDTVALLGSAADSASIAPGAAFVPCAVGRISSGEWLVSRVVGAGELAVYGPDGRRVRGIGKPGKGPGELGRDLRLIVAPGDTLRVIDNGNLRLTTLTHAGSLVSTVRLPAASVHGHADLGTGRVVLHGRPSGRPGDENPLFHVLDHSTGEARGFGAPSSTMELRDLDQWVVATGRERGSFWTASIWDYELYRWAGIDSLEYTLIREPDWFPDDPDLSVEAMRRMHVEVPAPATMTHVREAEDGLLWVYAWVPDVDWRPGPPENTAAWARRTFDTMIEVLDPQTSRVLTRTRYDDVLSPVCGEALVYTADETQEGDTRVRVLRPRLVR